MERAQSSPRRAGTEQSGISSDDDPVAQSAEQLPFKQWVRGSNPRRVTSSEIPTTVPFPALPETALWWEFLRFPPRLASLDAGARGTGGAGTAGLGNCFEPFIPRINP